MAANARGRGRHLAAAGLIKQDGTKVDYVAFGSGAQVIFSLLVTHIQIASVAGGIAPLVKAAGTPLRAGPKHPVPRS